MTQASAIAHGLWAKVQSGQYIAAPRRCPCRAGQAGGHGDQRPVPRSSGDLQRMEAGMAGQGFVQSLQAAMADGVLRGRHQPPRAIAVRPDAHSGRAEWSHDAVWHAVKECGFENLNTLARDLSAKLFERNYAIATRRLAAGQPLQKMPLALPAEAKSRSTPDVGRAALAALRAGRAQHAQA